jgi:hypothetical protein
MGDDEVIYKGFRSIEEAHAAWDEYCVRKILPPGLPAPARGSRTPTYRGSPSQQVAENPRTPQHIPVVPRAYHSTAGTPPPGPPPCLSQNAAVSAHGHGSVSLPRQFDTAARANAVGGAPSSHLAHQHAVNAPVLTNNFAVRSRNFGSALSTNFYAVLTGLAPGVYNGW